MFYGEGPYYLCSTWFLRLWNKKTKTKQKQAFISCFNHHLFQFTKSWKWNMGTVFWGFNVKSLQVIMKANFTYTSFRQSVAVVSRFRFSVSTVRLISNFKINNLKRRSSLRSKCSLFSCSFEIWFFSWKKKKKRKENRKQEYRCFPRVRVFYFPFPLYEVFGVFYML